jgi:hypothetical protein
MLPAILTHLSVRENSWRKPCVECALRKSLLKSPRKYFLMAVVFKLGRQFCGALLNAVAKWLQ